MAYVLGFWFADGYMRHEKSYRIVFNSNDYSLLLKIRECLGSSHLIYKRKNRTEYQLIIFSKRMYFRLQALGGKRRKTKSMEFPKTPRHYLADFIRGFFDGDGSVFYTTYRSTKNRKIRTELRSNFTNGDPRFLEELQSILIDLLRVSRKKICPYNERSSWKLGYATEDTKKLLQFMYYPNFSIGLERKASFLENLKK